MKKLVDSLKTALLFLLLQSALLLVTVFFAALYEYGQDWQPEKAVSLLTHYRTQLSRPGFFLFTAASAAFLLFRVSRKSILAFLLCTVSITASFFLPVSSYSEGNARLMEKAILPVNSRNSVYVLPSANRSPGSLILADPGSSNSSLDFLPTAEIQGTTLTGTSLTADNQGTRRKVSLSSTNPFAAMIYLSSRTFRPLIQHLRDYYRTIRKTSGLSAALFSVSLFPFLMLLAANSVFLYITRWRMANLVFYTFNIILFLFFTPVAIVRWQNLYPLFLKGSAMADALPSLILALYSAAIALLNVLVEGNSKDTVL